MRRLLPIPLALILLVTACGSGGEEESQVEPTVTVPATNTEDDASAGADESADEVAAMAFVATPADGDLTTRIEAGAPEPTVIEVHVSGSGDRSSAVGTDGVATVAYGLWTWDGELVEHSSDFADRLSLLLGRPSDSPPDAVEPSDALASVLAGMPVGARVTALFPAGTEGMPDPLRPPTATSSSWTSWHSKLRRNHDGMANQWDHPVRPPDSARSRCGVGRGACPLACNRGKRTAD